MKIYVITCGEYSDYMIDKIFLDEAKADSYLKYHPHCMKEEYEASDEDYNPVEPCWDAYTTAKIVEGKYGYTTIIASTEVKLSDNRRESYNGLYDYRGYSKSIGLELIVSRSFLESLYTQEQATEKIEKIVYDLSGKVIAMLADGAAVKDIEAAIAIPKGI